MTTPKFFPRPEAHPMKWDALMLPLKRAVRDLLVRIEGATSTQLAESAVISNCFLVYGQRGSGKTTVLLSAKYACDDARARNRSFFETEKKIAEVRVNSILPESQDVCQQSSLLLQDVRYCIKQINGVLWLDVLDLEPLSPRSNLLTTVLTRVRNGLCNAGPDKPSFESMSILENGVNSAYQKFSVLITDAAIMWEEVNESDTRAQANRRVDAADKYARFKAQFLDALKTLSEELGRRDGNRDACYRIILPIDNIDRSTELLHSIVKLAQMVSCPYLLLLMAGDRQDIDTFLERAYWKELIRVGEGGGGVGKADIHGEDETLVMARRQAAAASHKLLPPGHRIEVQLVDPMQTLAFLPMNRKGQPNKTIGQLFEEIEVTTALAGREKTEDERIYFIDFFYTKKFVGTLMNEIMETDQGSHLQYLTTAAKLCLRLPARGVLDLWQLAYWIRYGDPTDKLHRAEKIARTMLRNSIAESGMPSQMGRYLQEKFIQRNPAGGTILDFYSCSEMLVPICLTHLYFQFRSKQTLLIKGKTDIERELVNQEVVRSILLVRQAKVMGMDFIMNKGKGKEAELERLPDIVVGWLNVLHEAVIWGDVESVVVGRNPMRLNRSTVRHGEYNRQKHEDWPMPIWDTLIENEVCEQCWDFFLHHLDEGGTLFNQAVRSGYLPRLLLVCWVACALQTFSLFAKKEYRLEEAIFNTVKELIRNEKNPGQLSGAIDEAEKKVLLSGAEIYDKISRKKDSDLRGELIWLKDDRTLPIRDWLEEDLPLMLLTNIYVPLVGDSQARVNAVFEILCDTNLAYNWLAEHYYAGQRPDAWSNVVDASSRPGR